MKTNIESALPRVELFMVVNKGERQKNEILLCLKSQIAIWPHLLSKVNNFCITKNLKNCISQNNWRNIKGFTYKSNTVNNQKFYM